MNSIKGIYLIRMVGFFITLVGLVRLAISFLTIPDTPKIFSVHLILQYLFVFSQFMLTFSGFVLQHHLKKWAIIPGIIACLYSIFLSISIRFTNIDLLYVFILFLFLLVMIDAKNLR